MVAELAGQPIDDLRTGRETERAPLRQRRVAHPTRRREVASDRLFVSDPRAEHADAAAPSATSPSTIVKRGPAASVVGPIDAGRSEAMVQPRPAVVERTDRRRVQHDLDLVRRRRPARRARRRPRTRLAGNRSSGGPAGTCRRRPPRGGRPPRGSNRRAWRRVRADPRAPATGRSFPIVPRAPRGGRRPRPWRGGSLRPRRVRRSSGRRRPPPPGPARRRQRRRSVPEQQRPGDRRTGVPGDRRPMDPGDPGRGDHVGDGRGHVVARRHGTRRPRCPAWVSVPRSPGRRATRPSRGG